MMASKCRNIWDSLRSADLSTAVVSSPCIGSASESSLPSSSVTFLLPDPCVKVPFTGNGYGEKHSSTSNFSTSCSEERWKRRKYDHNFQRSLQTKPAHNGDGWSYDSRRNCSPYFKAESVMRNENSCNLTKVQNFAFEKVHLSPSVLPVNSSKVCSVSKSIRSAENNSFHHRASKTKCQLSSEAFPGYPVAVSRVVDHARSPILSQAEFGNYLSLNDANCISVENCVTNSKTNQKVSAKCDVTSSKNADIFVIDLICSTTQDCFSKSVTKPKKAKFLDSADMFLEREKSVTHDAVVPVLPESSCSLDIGCHSNDHDVDMENLSETEDIPSFKCPFDVEELVNVDESYGPGIFLGTGLPRSLPTSHSETSSVSTVAELQSTVCDLKSLRTSPVSLSGFISSARPISEIDETYCTRSCIDDKPGSLSQCDNEQMLIDKNYSKLQQLYQSKQLSNDLFHVDEWSSEADFEMTKSLNTGSSLAACGTRSRPRDDGSNLRAARAQLLNDDIRSAVEEVLAFLATDACPRIDPVSNTGEIMLQKTNSDEQRSPDLGVPLPDARESVITSSLTDCNISGPVGSVISLPSTRLNATAINTVEPVSDLKGVTFKPESSIPSRDTVKLMQKIPLDDSNVLKEVFNGENKKPDHNLDLCMEEDPAELINRRMNLESFMCPSRRPQFIPEFKYSADTIRISENAISPCSVFPPDECFLETWSHPSEMLSCTPVHNESVAKSCSDPSQATVTYLNRLDLRSGLSEFEGLSVSSTSPLGTEINSNFSLLSGSTRFRVDSSDEKNNLQDSHSESGLSELSENPNYMKTDGCSKKKRRPRMLMEIASSNGFIAERRPSHSSGSLFVDSKLLSREERVLQRVHMQITKMEVKEELIKFKKSKRFTETCDQTVNSQKTVVTGKFNRLVSHQKMNHCTKIRPSSRSMIHGKRLKNRYLWSSGIFKQQPAFSSCQQKILCCQNTREKKATKDKRKLKLANEARKFKFENLYSNVRLNDKVLKGCRCEWYNGSMFDVETLYASVDGTNSVTISPVAIASAVAKEPVYTFNEIDERFCLPVTPFIPSQVRRVIVCHGTGETILHKAARLGYEDVALWCCQSGFIDVNACDNVGYSPLHESCLNSQLRIAQYLIYYGSDVNSASEVDGRRPIHEAVESGCLETVRLLLSAGADINLTTYSGKSVLEISKSQEMKEFLRAYLSDLNGLNDEAAETDWQFIPIWSDDPSSHGLDLLCDAPPCDSKCNEFYVELSASCFEK